jgi:uncharacterized protein (TIRG00374 family)
LKRYVLPIVGTVLLLIYVSRLDLRALWAQVVDFPVADAVVVVALNAACVLVKAVRWRRFLGKLGTSTEFGRAYTAVLAAFFMGLVTPGTAGEFSRAASLDRDREKGVAVLVLEKFTDLLSLGILAALAAASFAASPAVFAGLLVALGAVLVAAYAAYFRLRNWVARPMKAVVLRLVSAEGAQSAGRVYQEFNRLTGGGSTVVASALYSVALWLLSLTQVALIYHGLGLTPSFRFVALTYFLPYLIGIVSLVPLGLGTFEMSLRQIGLHSASGIPAESVALVPAFFRVFVTLPLIGAGYACQVALALGRARSEN